MSYEFHLMRGKRDETGETLPFALDEWEKAVDSVDDIRLVKGPDVVLGRNPLTGEMLTIEACPGDVELRDGGDYVPFIMFRDGYPSLSRIDPEDGNSRATRIVFELVALLGARLEGEEGEEYPDPCTELQQR